MIAELVVVAVASALAGFGLGWVARGGGADEALIQLASQRDALVEALAERVASQAASMAAMTREGWNSPERWVPMRRPDPTPRITDQRISDFLSGLLPDAREVAEEWVLEQIAGGVEEDVVYENLVRGGEA